MPTISIRGTEMPASPIRKLAPLADAAKQRGIHVFHLNIGQPDLPTPQAAIDAIRNIDRKVLEYSPSAGYRSYREKLVGYYEKFNINLTADDIIITTGGSEAVLFSLIRETRSLFPNLLTPTIWLLPFRPELKYAPLLRQLRRGSLFRK